MAPLDKRLFDLLSKAYLGVLSASEKQRPRKSTISMSCWQPFFYILMHGLELVECNNFTRFRCQLCKSFNNQFSSCRLCSGSSQNILAKVVLKALSGRPTERGYGPQHLCVRLQWRALQFVARLSHLSPARICFSSEERLIVMFSMNCSVASSVARLLLIIFFLYLLVSKTRKDSQCHQRYNRTMILDRRT